MPSFNSLGEWCAGIAGVQSSWGTGSGTGTLIPGGLSADWVTDDVVVVQDCSAGACVLKTYNVRTGVSTQVAPRGANALSAGGGVWAAWFGGYGFFTSTGLHLPGAYLGSGGPEGTHGSVGPDGAVAVKRNYQSFGPYDVHEADGQVWLLTAGAASFPQLLGNRRAVWTEAGNPHTAGACPTPNPVTRPYSWLRMIPPLISTDPDGWWVLYQDADGRLLLHPVTSTSGYVVAPAGSLTYRPDFVRLTSTTIKVVWATNEGEAPSTVVVQTVVLTASRTVLGTAPPPVWTEPLSGSAAMLNDGRLIYSPWETGGLRIAEVPVPSFDHWLLYIVALQDLGGILIAGSDHSTDHIWLVRETGAAHEFSSIAFGQHALGLHHYASTVELVAATGPFAWNSWDARTFAPMRSGAIPGSGTSQGLLGFDLAGDPVWAIDPLDRVLNGYQSRLQRWADR